MLMLLLHIFLLLLMAYLLGAMIACLVKSAFAGRDTVHEAAPVIADTPAPIAKAPVAPAPVAPAAVAPTPAAQAPVAQTPASSAPEPKPQAAPATDANADRFGRALAGDRKDAPAAPAPAPAPSAPPAAAATTSDSDLAAKAAAAAAAVAAAASAAAAAQAQPRPASPPAPAAPAPVTAAPVPAVPAAPVAPPAPAKVETAEAPKPAPAAPPAPAAAPAAPAAAPVAAMPMAEPAIKDDLTRIRAIDSDVQSRLYGLGVYRFADMANWTSSDVNRMTQTLGFVGRIEKENWIEQAQILAKGGDTAYSRRPASAPVAAAASTTPAAPPAAAAASAAASAAVAAATAAARKIGTDASAAAETLHPVNLADAIRETASKATETVTTTATATAAATTATAAATLAAATAAATAAAKAAVDAASAAAPALTPAAPAAPAAAPSAERDYSHLRSVRSEALRSEPAPTPLVIGGSDDLKRIRGIGVLIEKKLHSLGITSYEQIANWTGADVERLGAHIEPRGRVERENWIEQARILASGGQTDYARRFDRGEIPSGG